MFQLSLFRKWSFKNRKETEREFTEAFDADSCQVAYGAEWSTTLEALSWTPTADTGTGETYTFSVPMTGHPLMFVRWKISFP